MQDVLTEEDLKAAIKQRGLRYHITLSLEEPARPVDANGIFQSVSRITGFQLSGTVQILGG